MMTEDRYKMLTEDMLLTENRYKMVTEDRKKM